MSGAADSGFEPFAAAFVRKYWETVKSNAFPMAPDEPVTETVDELLSKVSYETDASNRLRMSNELGDWWLFTFRSVGGRWELVAASANSHRDEPHDLLGPSYAEDFGPFLHHVAAAANDAQRTQG